MIPVAPSRPVGRPVIQIDYPAIIRMAKQGMALDSIADRLGVDRKTLSNHMAKMPELRAAYNAGVADLVDLASGKLRSMVEAGDLGAVIFTLRTKGGFTVPKQELAVTVTTQHGPTIDGHIEDIALEHARLLDGPSPDDIPDIEIVE